MKKVITGIAIVLLVVGALGGIKAFQIKTLIASAKNYSQPPETVASAEVREEKWQGILTAIGSVTAVQGVMITPELAGTVREINFESGAVVAKGDLLVKLDTSSEEAQLRSLEAQVQWAKVTLDRQTSLRTNQLVSQSDYDSAEAAWKQAVANADTVKATIEKKTLRAPFAGQLGIRQVNLGQYLDAGKPIVSLQSLIPVYADFSLPQQELGKLKPGMQVRITTDTYPDRKFDGKLLALNPDLDLTTRSVALRATFENPDQLLRPGMFAKVAVLLPEEENVLVIPATAVLRQPYGDSVFVIEPAPEKVGQKSGGLVVRSQIVKTGEARGDLITITTGLKAGERVVSAGGLKLRNGMAVSENNDLVPRSEKSPHPPEA
jgi:membrane fusion protein (multidrug efflux system)